MSKRTAQIFDMDGTLVNVDSILHFVQGEKKDFEAFHSNAIDADPHFEVVHMVNEAVSAGDDIIIVTARKEMWRAQTSFWLAWWGIPSDALFMRGNRDNRPDYEVKSDILAHIEQCWDVVHATDDNPSVIKLWQEKGIPTTKFGNWDILG